MLRFIFLIILFYLLYRFIKGLLYPSEEINISTITSRERPEEDEMVRDPYCDKYVPKRNSYSAKINGEFLYFCSNECLEKYKQEKASN
ncbi:MAG: hypothetical protein ABIJ37_01690 [Pseudomonadota bacterium]